MQEGGSYMVTLDTDKSDVKREEQVLRKYAELLLKSKKADSKEK